MIIGLLGNAGHGKDAVGELLRDRAGFTSIALADPMKRAAKEWFGFTDEQLWGPSALRNAVDLRWGISPRHALQQLGTEYGRSCHPDLWIRQALRTATDLLSESRYGYLRTTGVVRLVSASHPAPRRRTGIVITDTRFQNEVDAIRAAGGVVWRVERPNASPLAGDAADHVSETEQRSVRADKTLSNNGTLHDLAATVHIALGEPR